MNTIENFMQTQVNKQLLRFAAGHAIFCPNCQEIMDCRRTVVAEILRQVDARPEESIQTYTLCAKCWDKVSANVTLGIEKAIARCPAGHKLAARVDVIDGRQLFTDDTE